MDNIEHTFLNMTTSIVSAFVSNNAAGSYELPGLIKTTYEALKNTQIAPEPEALIAVQRERRANRLMRELSGLSLGMLPPALMGRRLRTFIAT